MEVAAVVAGITTCTVAAMRVYLAVRLAAIRASLASTPQEYAMLERSAHRPRRKAKQPAPPIPYGL